MTATRETTAAGTAGAAGEPYRVMVVDDSAVVRGLETRMLESDAAIKVVASVGNGQAALQALERQDIEVVVLDIEMPVMDGLTALPEILKRRPGVKVIMSSTLTQQNAEISLRALELGATDYVPKPSTSRELTGESDFRSLLVEKVKALGAAARRGAPPLARRAFSADRLHAGTATAARPFTAARGAAGAAPAGASPSTPSAAGAAAGAARIALRPAPSERPDVIAIGSSTGGPQALFTVLGGIQKAGGVTQPILITQHMPATFTTILAEHIGRLTGMAAREGQDGEKVENGRVYIAPGDYHMLVESRGGDRIIRLNQGAPENFCRPSVDPMFRSIAAAWGRKVLACVLTGMGADGAKGGKVVADAGGSVIAQDEATSVVWGMPGATAQAGVCSAVLPIGEVAGYIHKLATRRA